MKSRYFVSIWENRLSYFEEYYDKKEIEAIKKFFNDLKKHDVVDYVPYIEFEKKQ